jgi:hypothetical protein
LLHDFSQPQHFVAVATGCNDAVAALQGGRRVTKRLDSCSGEPSRPGWMRRRDSNLTERVVSLLLDKNGEPLA